MIRGYLVTAHREGSDIILWLRSEHGKHRVRVKGFKPYFYVPAKLGDYVSIFGEPLRKVYVQDPSDVRRERSKYPRSYEADIPYTRRFVIDTGIHTCVEVDVEGEPAVTTVMLDRVKPCDHANVKPHIWYFDIEVYAEHLPQPDNPTDPIIAMSLYSTEQDMYHTWFWHPGVEKEDVRTVRAYGKPWVIHFHQTEESMLSDFAVYLARSKPDYITGWNIWFDKDYLLARYRYLGLKVETEFLDWFDMLEADKYIVKGRRGRALKHVTVEEGIETREEAREAMDMIPLWQEAPWEVVKYNLRDVWRTVRLDGIYRYLDTYLAYKDVTGLVHLRETVQTLLVVDIMVLRTAKKRGVVLPTGEEKPKKRYKGAIVLDPTPGLYEGVAVFDMSKYYPSIMISFNTSPETKLRQVDKVENIWEFRRDKPGIIPEAVKDVIIVEERTREEQKKYRPGDRMFDLLDKKVVALKGVRNSFYGATGKEKFRLYDPDVASTVTGLGREGILFLKETSEEMGYRVMYGDTDSIFIQVPFEKAGELAEELTARLRKYFMEKYGLEKEPQLELKFEKYYRRILFTEAKKRYAGWVVWKKGREGDKIDIVGFEAVRTDSARFTGYAQMRVAEHVLRNGYRQDELEKLLKELEQEFENASLEDIALYAQMTKPPSAYAVGRKPPHVRAAVYSNMYLGTSFGAGDKIKYIWVKGVKGYPQTDVVAFDSEERIRDIVVVDMEKMKERVLYGPLENFLRALGHVRGATINRWW